MRSTMGMTTWILAFFCGLSFAPAVFAGVGTCVPSATTLCLGGNRYQVDVDWQSTTSSGEGQVFSFATTNSGFFTLEDPDTVEVLVSVLDGCTINDNSWVFLADLSSNQMTLTAADTSGGASQQYEFNLGASRNPLADTSALACPTFISPVPQAPLLRRGSDPYLEMVSGRFRVSVEWDSQTAGTGPATPVHLTDSSGAFWYFNDRNLDMLLKIEPHPSNGFYRLVAGSPSTVGFTITVQDTCLGTTQAYSLMEGGPLTTVIDEQMHAIDCIDHVFANGFESGDTSLWSSTAP